MLSLISCITLALGLSACDSCDREESERHKHEYITAVTEPTCTTRGYTTYTCGCGSSYVADYTDPLNHDFDGTVCTRCGYILHDHDYERSTVEPDCTNQGYTQGVCKICGATYKTNIVDPLGHDFVNNKCTRCEALVPTDGLEYTLSDDGEYYICSGKGTATDTVIVIADEYNGKSVKAIGEAAFGDIYSGTPLNTENIQGIIIPNTVISIGERAFFNCDNLIDIIIPSSVIQIDGRLFGGCVGVTIYCEAESKPSGWNDGWNNNGYYPAVWNCKINEVAEDGYIYTYIDGLRYALKDDYAVVARQIRKTDGEKIIPQAVTYKANTYHVVSIADNAFNTCVGLIGVHIDYGVVSIGERAFYSCNGLMNITLPDSLSTIAKSAFNGCSRLTNIKLFDSITTIGDYSFASCRSLINIDFKGTKSQWDAIEKGGRWDTGTGDYIIHCKDGNILKDGTFEHDHEFEQKTVEPDCINAGYTVFICRCGHSYKEVYTDSLGHDFVDGQCTRCKVLKPTDGLEYNLFDDGAYYICTGIGTATESDIVIASDYNGKPVTEIAESAFSDQRFLMSITIPDSITTIGDYAFSYCNWLTSITIPVSVTVMGRGVFSFCDGLTIYCEASSQPTDWEKYWNTTRPVIWDCKNNDLADDGCIYTQVGGIRYSLKDGSATVLMQSKKISGEINVPQRVMHEDITYKVTTIADSAFESCYDLTGIIIPEGVISIGDSAFQNCSWFIDAEIPDSVKSIGKYAFAYCGRLKSIIIPHGIVIISEGAFRQCTSITSVTIPDTVTQIDKMAFYCCDGLTSVTVPDSVSAIGDFAFGYCCNLQSITIGSGVKEIGNCIFDYYDKVTDIYYNGTTDEWNAIVKSESWDGPLIGYTIHCTDGDIVVNKEESENFAQG